MRDLRLAAFMPCVKFLYKQSVVVLWRFWEVLVALLWCVQDGFSVHNGAQNVMIGLVLSSFMPACTVDAVF